MAIIADIREHVTLPILLTIRRLSEGGYFFGEEVERLAYFKSLLPAVDAVDIELYDTQDIREQIIEHAHKQSKTVVLSYHNFRRTPSERRFSEIVEDAVTVGGDIVKIAVMAEKVEDVELLMKFTTDFNAREILLATMSMGDLGRVTRAVNPFLGSCLTYGYVGEVPTTPGQLPVRELRAVLDLFPGQRIPVASLDVVYGLLKKVAHKATSSPVRESAGAV